MSAEEPTRPPKPAAPKPAPPRPGQPTTGQPRPAAGKPTPSPKPSPSKPAAIKAETPAAPVAARRGDAPLAGSAGVGGVFENPVLLREFITTLRTPKAMALGIFFVVSLSFLVMLMWPGEGAFSLEAQASHELFTLLAMGQLAMVVMFAPSFSAVSITSEKERETYGLLYHTMLKSGQIISGKLASGIGFLLILMLGSLPMMGACFVLGGVDWPDMLRVYLIIAASALLFGLAGMLCSCLCRSSYSALVACYVVILGICGATWIPSIIMGTRIFVVHELHLVRALSPFAAMISVVNPDFFSSEHAGGAEAFGKLADGMLPFIALAIVGSVALLVKCLIEVAKPPQPRKRRDERIIDQTMEHLKRKLTFPFYIFDPRARKNMIGPVLNIMAVKEMRSKAFGRIQWVIRSMYVCVIVSILLAFLPLGQVQTDSVPIPTIILACLSMPMGLILLVSPVLTSSTISDERSSGVFDGLRMTRISPLTIVLGKLEVAWFFVLLLLSSTFPTFFIMGYLSSPITEMDKIATISRSVRTGMFGEAWTAFISIDVSGMLPMLKAILVSSASIFFVTTVGIFLSSFVKKSSLSTALAYGVTFVFGIGTLLPYFLAENLPGWLVNFFVTLNPFAAIGKAASGKVFVTLGNDLWFNHVLLVFGLGLVLFAATVARVWDMMRPAK